MDLDLRDKRNRFQVNRVDSVGAGHPSVSPGSGHSGVGVGPTLVGYTPQSDGNISCNGKSNGNGHCVAQASDISGDDVTEIVDSCSLTRVLWRKQNGNHSNISESSLVISSKIEPEPTDRTDESLMSTIDTTEAEAELCDVGIDDKGDGCGDGRMSPPSEGASPAKLISPSHRQSIVDQSHFTLSGNYDTKYAKSFRHFTREALPRLDNYRNMMSIQAAYRPTLDELHDLTVHGKVSLKIYTRARLNFVIEHEKSK
jgi:hypothetical protein